MKSTLFASLRSVHNFQCVSCEQAHITKQYRLRSNYPESTCLPFGMLTRSSLVNARVGGGGGGGGEGEGGWVGWGYLPIYGIVRMSVPNGPLFQRCQVSD